MNVRAAKPDSKIIAILPPSFDVWRERFEKREKITETEFRNRVKTAEKVIELVRRDPAIRVVINDEYHIAAEAVDRFVHDKPQTEEERHKVGQVLDDLRDTSKISPPKCEGSVPSHFLALLKSDC